MKRIIRTPDGTEITFDITLSQYRKRPLIVFASEMDEEFEVETLEGTMRGQAGDYLVCGIKGEYYPVRKDIFEASYEPRIKEHHKQRCGHCKLFTPKFEGHMRYGECPHYFMPHIARKKCEHFRSKEA